MDLEGKEQSDSSDSEDLQNSSPTQKRRGSINLAELESGGSNGYKIDQSQPKKDSIVGDM